MSAVLPDYRTPPLLPGLSRREDLHDVDMVDAGPSTAPLQQGNTTFFHDD
jgi:F-box and WD-40 domain protein CDC4